jgi:hypothetical protein
VTHKAILICPQSRTVTEIDQVSGLQPLYDILSLEGLRPCDDINAVRVSDRDAMYVDGEGLLIANMPMFSFVSKDPMNASSFAGRGLIVGTNDEGDDVDHTLNVEQVRAAVIWLELETTGGLQPSTTLEGDAAPDGFDYVYKVGEPILREKP